ncbi:MAG: DUF1287 domain-containing protein [Polyangiales bacterium]
MMRGVMGWRAWLWVVAACTADGVQLRSAAQAPTPSAPWGATQAPARASPLVAAESSLGVRDVGIFDDLNPRVQLVLAPGLLTGALDLARQQLVVYDGRPLKVYPLGGAAVLRVGERMINLRHGDRAELQGKLAPERLYVFEGRIELPPGDADDDGIPDPLDVQLGAIKTALNADHYDGRYVPITYPGGDVPREIGVCTDVVIRALRNAGHDLQRELQDEVRAAPGAFPAIHKPNPQIDHRRVKNLLPLFQRRYELHSAALHDAADPLRAGDVVFMDTFPDRPGAEHIGILAEERGPGGLPLVINNWTDGTVTMRMDLLPFVPVTHRFRLRERLPAQGPISPWRTQLVLVTAAEWSSTHAELRRFSRAPGRAWRAEGGPQRVVIGRAGYGWGNGLHGEGAPAGRSGPRKREGDGRSPAGAFELGAAYGYAPPGQPPLQLPYTQVDASHRCVDDPRSASYNQIVSTRDTTHPQDWQSAEEMHRSDDLYELAIEIAHNRAPTRPGHGSCIFVHVWSDPNTPVTGCTALDKQALFALAARLHPRSTVWVSLPQSEYQALRKPWGLP